ncbi:TPA: hypothetical protein L4Q98_005839 [Pseudomonas aeruginosa]|nr:hypothetical protein [Pseudomonas aeruginosa]
MTPSKIQMDQIRSTSATDTGENIRAGSQKKSSLSPAEGLQGASPDATCTCPSGDGSIRHPCPAHPAVEQEGGDERAAFEAAYQTEHAGFMGPLKLDRREDGEYKSEHVGSAWRMWQARAALAQPPVSDPLMFACKSLAQITSSDGSGHADIALAVLRMAGVSTEEREQLVNGWKARRAWSRSPTQAEKAEVERPEVVARVVHSNPVVLDHCGPLNANDELMTVAQHAASVARWAEMFNRVEQERDAALARVAELEAHCVRPGQGEAERYWENRWSEADARLAELEKLRSVLGVNDMEQAIEREDLIADLIDAADMVIGNAEIKSPEDHTAFTRYLRDLGVLTESLRYKIKDVCKVSNCSYWRAKLFDEATNRANDLGYVSVLDALAGLKAARAMAAESKKQQPSFWTRKKFGEDREFCEEPFTTDWKPLYAAPVAQAQHSVPEGYALIPTRETEAMHDAVMALLYKGVARTDTQKLLDAYIAAAPGKEVGHE